MKESLPTPGTIISHYRILSRLARAGWGEVYLEEDTMLRRKVAIRLLRQREDADEQAQERLIKEVQTVATLDHPNICSIYEVARDTGLSFIVLQYVEGETLARMMQRTVPGLGELLDIAVQVADALSEAHSRGIIHRDIKPQNIMVTPRGQVKGERLDACSDIFSFGVVLYEMTSGHQPFMANSTGATISAILTREPPPLARYSK